MVETENEYIDKAEEERRAIISNYEKGRDGGVEILPWEDPTFEIYHVTDHYGFIHDQRLPNIGAEERKKKNIEAERGDKWAKMLREWDKYKNSEKLRKRTYKGIPNKIRPAIWGALLELGPLKEQQPGRYTEMLKLAKKYSPDIRQIDLDVNRTYRDHIHFQPRYGPMQQSLFNVLSAYSVYNREVGYCQGMSNLAALLLIYLTEEDAFWGLAQLMTHPRYRMHGFFIAGFPKLVRFQKRHDEILKNMLPRLKKHFDKHGVDSGLYTLKWFFQCFLDRVPFDLALRYWDIYLLDGERVLLCGAYSILKMHSKNLLAKKNMDDILTYIQSKIPTNFDCDSDKAIEFYQKCLEELHRKKLDTAGNPGDDELVKRPFGLIDDLIVAPSPQPPPKKPVQVVEKPLTPVKNVHHEPEPEPEPELEKLKQDPIHEDESPTVKPEKELHQVKDMCSKIERLDNEITDLEHRMDTQVSLEIYASSSRIGATSPNSLNTLEIYHAISTTSPTHRVAGNNYGATSHQGNSPRRHTHSNDFTQASPMSPPSASPRYSAGQQIIDSSGSYGRSPADSRNISKSPVPHAISSRNAFFETHEEKSTRSSWQNIEAVEKRSSASSRNSMDAYERHRPRSISPSSPTSIPNDSILRNPSPSSSVHIPSGEAVRIHVPYNSSPSPSHHTNYPASSNPRTIFDLNKSDPNRIKIDVSSGSAGGILG